MNEAESLSERQSKLSPAKQALLKKWMRGQDSTAARPTIPRRSTQSPALLSFAQQRMWFLDQLVPGNPAYNIPTALRLSGRLDVTVLQRCLNEIVRRHEALRTIFLTENGQPSQVMVPSLSLPMPLIDLRACPAEKQEALVRRLAAEESRQPFDLTQLPLLRATLLRLAPEEHVFLLTMHHIVSDGWSAGVFLREMALLYDAFSEGQPSPLPELPIQYADFAIWQRDWLQGERLETQLSFWQEQLGGSLPTLDLPADRPRPAVQSYRGARRPFALTPSLSQAVKALSQQKGVTLFVALLAGFKILLHRYTGQEDILVGSPIANRNRKEVEGLIGLFVNMLVLRTDLSGEPSFQTLLGRVRETTTRAYAHQDLPFEKLVEVLQPERDLSRSPLFQAMFVLQNVPTPKMRRSDLSLRGDEIQSGTTQLDLRMAMEEREDGLIGLVEYSVELFDADTISRLVDHFQCLLIDIVADPTQRLADLALLSTAERQQLLNEWNYTAKDYPQVQQECLHQMIEAQVTRTPDATALVFEAHHLSYRELDRRANQLAHHLRILGVGPEAFVGLCAERSPEMVIGLLGTLKAGSAYVPLDPTYPLERLAFMLTDAQVPVLLTQQRLLASLPEHTAQTVCLDAEWQHISQADGSNLSSEAEAESLAYMIYTSGSTGKPKGAMNAHRGIVNRLLWMQEAYRLDATDRVLQKTPFSFDVSVWEFFWPLLTGACLVVARPEGHKDCAYLVRTMHSTSLRYTLCPRCCSCSSRSERLSVVAA